jgi:hypothetical protein
MEFKRHLETDYYDYGVLVIHNATKEVLHNSYRKLAGCAFWGPLLKQKWFDVDLSNVPTKEDVRIHMRQATLWPFLKQQNDLD